MKKNTIIQAILEDSRTKVIMPAAPNSKNFLRNDYSIKEWRNGKLVTLQMIICWRRR